MAREIKTAPGERSKKLSVYKQKVGLPKLRELHELEDRGLVADVERRIEIFERYAAAQRELYSAVTAMGWDASKVAERVAELEMLMIQRKSRLEESGHDPLEDEAYMNARKELMQNIKFMHQHGLDRFKFEKELEKRKQSSGDDIFEVTN